MNSFFQTVPGFVSAEKLAQSASHRVYWRLHLTQDADTQMPGRNASHGPYEGLGTLVGVEGTDAAENRSFIEMSRFFGERGVNVPRVLAQSPDGLCYIQEDLGDDVLRNHLDDKELLKESLRALVRMQQTGRDFDFQKYCFATKEFCPRIIDFDLNYFKYCFLKVYGAEFNEHRLQDDFDRMRADLLAVESDTFLYRDFQSRNVMVRDGEPWFIDFQGGFKGPFYYDLCSFVFQASAGFNAELKAELIDTYYDTLCNFKHVERCEFDANVQLFALFRCLQTLGAYGFRGLTERKQYFIDSIPAGLRNFRSLMDGNCGERYLYLKELAYELDSNRI